MALALLTVLSVMLPPLFTFLRTADQAGVYWTLAVVHPSPPISTFYSFLST